MREPINTRKNETRRGTPARWNGEAPDDREEPHLLDGNQMSIRVFATEERARREVAEAIHRSIQSVLLHAEFSLKEIAGDLRQLRSSEADRLSLVVDQIERLNGSDLRRFNHRLYPVIIRLGLKPAVWSLIEDLGSSIPTRVEIEDSHPGLVSGVAIGEDLRLTTYRFIEAALDNVYRHSNARNASVRVDVNGTDGVQVIVSDDGDGFDVASVTEPSGLQLMEDYCRLWAGSLRVSSRVGAGTELAGRFRLDKSLYPRSVNPTPRQVR